MKKQAKPSHNETAAARVAAAMERGFVLVAHNALAREDTTAGPYHEAVDRGIRFAVIGWRSGREFRCADASSAAAEFVGRVGSTRAREAAAFAERKACRMV